jgi:hypothetical protein
VEYPEFIEIMTSTLSKLAHKKEEEGSGASQVGALGPVSAEASDLYT